MGPAGRTAVLGGLGLLVLAACTDGDAERRTAGAEGGVPSGASAASGDPGASAIPSTRSPAPTVDAARPAAGARDSAIAIATLRWALDQGLDSVPIGVAVSRIGRRFVGSPYTPGTLDPPGPETLVINLREFDCVTFVENVLALARTARSPDPSFATFARELERVRYRGGVRSGYASRLHYFSEWLSDNAARGILELVTPALGGVPDSGPIRFMSEHPDAYRQLADPVLLRRIGEIEARLSAVPRYVLPEGRIAAVEDGITEGDVIAATSALPGLDVAHTGIAVAVNGRIHLMHAPLVGDSVQISEVPLADRIRRIEAQDGIMVARPR